ncbi:MAG: YqaA family protein [Acidobacteriota bacterium]
MKIIRGLYDWVLKWGNSKYSVLALFIVAFGESSFFPIPPDILLITLSIGAITRSFYFAFIASLGSVLGGMFGYLIGLKFFEIVGIPIINFYGWMEEYNYAKELYNHYDAWAVSIAGFTPVPYKLATITAGVCKIDFKVFVIASALSRSARFFLVALLFRIFGERVKGFIDKYFNLLTIVFFILLILGFLFVKYIL